MCGRKPEKFQLKPADKAYLRKLLRDGKTPWRIARRAQSLLQRAEQKEQQIAQYSQSEALSTLPVPASQPASQLNEILETTTNKLWWVPSFTVKEAESLVRSILSTEITDSPPQEIPMLSFLSPNGMLSFGHVTATSAGSSANPNIEIGTDGGKADVGETPSFSAGVKPGEPELDMKMRIPSPVAIDENGVKGSLGYSVKVAAKWEGWNTTITADLNYADVNVSTGDVGLKGNMTSGVYVKYKPIQLATVTVGATLLVGAVVAAVVTLGPVIGGFLGGSTGALTPQFLR